MIITLIGTIIIDYIKSKKNIKITCERLLTRIYKEKESDDVKISLSYKNEKVGDCLCVMIVRIKNEGRKEISFKQRVDGEIELISQKHNIIEITINKQSDRVGAVIKKTDSLQWFLSWGILKKKEFIDLKIVSVFDSDVEEYDGIEVFDNDPVFCFRGNNINNIDRVGPQKERRLIKIVMFTLLLLISTFPLYWTSLRVKYDVVIDDQIYHNSHISYNAFNSTFRVISDEKSVCKTTEIDNIQVSKQKMNIREIISVCSIFLLYAGILLSYLLLYWNLRKKGFKRSALYKIYRYLINNNN